MALQHCQNFVAVVSPFADAGHLIPSRPYDPDSIARDLHLCEYLVVLTGLNEDLSLLLKWLIQTD
ncbi:MAG: hypothetical protein KF768_12920 [Phycisphaeraceae bacterium]|nr:hypothetical protein [Phycisphaeraceae bacterium]